MPFDKNGVELRENDTVTIHCKVRTVIQAEEGNNVILETLEEHFPTNSYSVVILNSKQVQKV